MSIRIKLKMSINPYLTTVAQNANSQEFVGHHLFPSVFVPLRGGKLIDVEGHENILYETKRVPGSSVALVQYEFQDRTFNLEQHSLMEVLPRELLDEGSVYPSDSLKEAAKSRALRKVGLRIEYDQAQQALNPANYSVDNKRTLSGTEQWTDEDSTPTLDIEMGKKAIRAKKGYYPNVALLSDPAFSAVRLHPAFQGRNPITPEYLADLWDIEKVVVGKATYQKSGVFNDVWGRNIVLAYVPQLPEPDLQEPCFGYTYRLTGCPFVKEEDLDPANQSWFYTATDEVRIKIMLADAGYLLQEVVPAE